MADTSSSPTLYLHVGHGKTGSSYLQTCFATSLDVLEAKGISYPIDPVPLKRARDGLTTEGNLPPVSLAEGHAITAFRDKLDRAVESFGQTGEKRVLFSNEGLFQSILLNDFLEQIAEEAPEYDIQILLFTRDPFDHLVSAYQELLKADIVDDAESLFEKSSVPHNVGQFLSKADAVGATVTVANFSRHRKALKQIAERWLGLDDGDLRTGPRASVNRSLDKSEILVQRAFNTYVGNFARSFVADALARELPDHKPTLPFIDHGVLGDFLERMERDTKEVNSRLPESEHYRVIGFDDAVARMPTPENANTIELTMEQLDVIARNVSRFLPPERQKKSDNKT